MQWNLVEEKTKGKKAIRLYRSDNGSECETELIYTDKDGAKWWGFRDLYKMPYLRTAMGKHISDLFSIGLSLKHILNWCDEEKKLINGNDPEKMQKLYALILEKENIAKQTADPIQQHLALCSVYVMADKERIDYFSEEMAGDKMILWKADTTMISFFLSWLNGHMSAYMIALKKTSQIVSTMEGAELMQNINQ